MNKPLQKTETALDVVEEKALIDTLSQSLYPGAKPDSIKMVLSYCRAAQLDPMLKPVHIVPMSVKVAQNKWEWRDVVMPGIAHYRVQASRSGVYAGKTEPEFGPVVENTFGMKGADPVKYPEYCKVTVYRVVAGHMAAFTATEIWTENYATAGRDTKAPNAMWRRRPFAQLAKCAEAQALRMAFPELIGGAVTAEEMEGKEIDESQMRDITPQPAPSKTEAQEKRKEAAKGQLDGFAGVDDAGNPAPLPKLPAEAAEALADNRWGAAWKWLEAQLPNIDPSRRQEFLGENSGVVAKAMSNNKTRPVLAKMAADMGIEIGAGSEQANQEKDETNGDTADAQEQAGENAG